MLTYPTLNGRPVDKWMVTELKDELRQRNLPITGLKDDLVRRLFEAIQDEENTDGGTLPAEGLKGGETPGSVDVSVYEASGEADVDEGVSEVMKQGEDVVISVTESINESLVPTTEAIHEAVISTVETGQRTLNDDTEVVPYS
jgi:apoptotic chromatin condensation inducer in the nucleus